MLTIEFEPPKESRCSCCNGVTVTLTRFVHDEEGPVAVYKARFGRGHPDRVVEILVSIGDWEEGAQPWDRVAFPLRMWLAQDQFAVGLTEAEESPWRKSTLFGRILNREEALAHERVKEVFHVTDHIAREDAAIRQYLEGSV